MVAAQASLKARAGTAVLVFCVFVAANAFFVWSTDAWFEFLGPPPGLVNPVIDKWVIMPLALMAWAPQFVSYVVFDYVERLQHFEAFGSVVIVSLLSSVMYTPVVLWVKRRRRMRRAA